MPYEAAVLGIHLMGPDQQLVRVGTLTRDAAGGTAFAVDEAYYRSPDRPLLSLRWHDVQGEDATRARLADRNDKIGLNGNLPAWFAGLLPEGALRELVEREMGPGNHGDFDVLARLGAALPGAVVAVPETRVDTAGPLRWERVGRFEAVVPNGVVKFSLAGVQLKFAVDAEGERLTMPARSSAGRYILKAPSTKYPELPEAEYTAMLLCRTAGIAAAEARLVKVDQIDGIPSELLAGGDHALAVERFDRRADGGRIHIEDMAQVIGAAGDRKYTMSNSESILNMVSRFSAGRLPDITEAMRRLAADILIGNGDNHLKNWSFIFHDGRSARLSPAYDIVPTVLYVPRDRLALPFIGKRDFTTVALNDFERAGRYLRLRDGLASSVVGDFVEKCLEVWPRVLDAAPLGETSRVTLSQRLETLTLVDDVRRQRSGRRRSSRA